MRLDVNVRGMTGELYQIWRCLDLAPSPRIQLVFGGGFGLGRRLCTAAESGPTAKGKGKEGITQGGSYGEVPNQTKCDGGIRIQALTAARLVDHDPVCVFDTWICRPQPPSIGQLVAARLHPSNQVVVCQRHQDVLLEGQPHHSTDSGRRF